MILAEIILFFAVLQTAVGFLAFQNIFKNTHNFSFKWFWTKVLVFSWKYFTSYFLCKKLKSGAAIDDYVNFDDGYFSWEEIYEYRFDGVTLYMANMTSQKWLNGQNLLVICCTGLFELVGFFQRTIDSVINLTNCRSIFWSNMTSCCWNMCV